MSRRAPFLLSIAIACALTACGGGGGGGGSNGPPTSPPTSPPPPPTSPPPPPPPPPPAVNTAPTIRNDVITASGSNPLIDVLANDTDPDGEALTLTLEGTPDFGTAAVENGRIRLTLPAGFQGFNTFSYRAVDAAGAGTTARAVVFVDTEPVRFFYITNEEGAYAQNIYVDDLLTRRRVTSFDGNNATALGSWMFVSDNGRTIVYVERDNTGAGLGERFWTAAPADGSSDPRRINPPLSTGQTLETDAYLSPKEPLIYPRRTCVALPIA